MERVTRRELATFSLARRDGFKNILYLIVEAGTTHQFTATTSENCYRAITPLADRLRRIHTLVIPKIVIRAPHLFP